MQQSQEGGMRTMDLSGVLSQRDNFSGPFSRELIVEMIEKGIIEIDPFSGWHAIGADSIDLSFGRELRIQKTQAELNATVEACGIDLEDGKYDIVPFFGAGEMSNYLDFTRPALVKEDCSYYIRPGETVLAMTQERLMLPTWLCAEFDSRSCLARFFVASQYASHLRPGINNRTVVEFHNNGLLPIAIEPGASAFQIVLHPVTGNSREYDGKYKNQMSLIQPGEIPELVGVPNDIIRKMNGESIVAMRVPRAFVDDLNQKWPIK